MEWYPHSTKLSHWKSVQRALVHKRCSQKASRHDCFLSPRLTGDNWRKSHLAYLHTVPHPALWSLEEELWYPGLYWTGRELAMQIRVPQNDCESTHGRRHVPRCHHSWKEREREGFKDPSIINTSWNAASGLPAAATKKQSAIRAKVTHKWKAIFVCESHRTALHRFVHCVVNSQTETCHEIHVPLVDQYIITKHSQILILPTLPPNHKEITYVWNSRDWTFWINARRLALVCWEIFRKRKRDNSKLKLVTRYQKQ